MGMTRYRGPVYGAKTLLAVAHKENVAAGASALEIFQVDVPATEDWYVCNVSAYCDVQGNGGTVDVKDDGTSILDAAIILASDDAVEGAITKTPGEDEGKKVEAGSVLTVHATDGATTAIEDVTVSIWGYIRHKDTP